MDGIDRQSYQGSLESLTSLQVLQVFAGKILRLDDKCHYIFDRFGSSIILTMEELKSGQFSKSIQRFDGIKVNLEVKQKHLHSKKRKVKTWTPDQDQHLIQLYNQYPKKWALIASLMNDRNQNQCLHRYRRISQFGAHRKIWSPEEDQTIKKLMKKVGKNWKLLAEMLGTKTGKQIRERFINKLDPKIKKEDWTDEEDRKIIELFSQIGRKWSQISKFLPGRPENKIKNRFYSYIQKNYDIKYRPIDQNQENQAPMKKQSPLELRQQASAVRVSLKDIINRVQKSSLSMGEKEDRFFSFNFPSINQLDLDMRMDDFPEEPAERLSKPMINSMIKIEEEWGNKEKDYDFANQMEFQTDLFYLSNQ